MLYNISRGNQIMEYINLTLGDLQDAIYDWATISWRINAVAALAGVFVIKMRLGDICLGQVAYEEETPKGIALEIKNRYSIFNNNKERVEKALGSSRIDRVLRKVTSLVWGEIEYFTGLILSQANATMLGNRALNEALKNELKI